VPLARSRSDDELLSLQVRAHEGRWLLVVRWSERSLYVDPACCAPQAQSTRLKKELQQLREENKLCAARRELFFACCRRRRLRALARLT